MTKNRIQICFLLLLLLVTGGCGKDVLSYAIADDADSVDEEEELSSGEETAEAGEEAVVTGAEAAGAEEGQQVAVTEAVEDAPIYVYVCGAVANAGVVSLPAGSRVFEALEAAGGLTEEADTRTLNQAAFLEDGEQITVLTREEAAETDVTDTDPAADRADTAGTSSGDSGKVNLNTATAEELQSLPGIGQAKAAAILSYRETYGAFASIEELMNISGIKEKTFQQLQDLIEV